jgi:hypothetical protein
LCRIPEAALAGMSATGKDIHGSGTNVAVLGEKRILTVMAPGGMAPTGAVAAPEARDTLVTISAPPLYRPLSPAQQRRRLFQVET